MTTAGTLTTPEPFTTNGGSVNIGTGVAGGNAGFKLFPNGADDWQIVATGSISPPNTVSFYNPTAGYTPLAIYSHAGASSVGTYESTGIFGWNGECELCQRNSGHRALAHPAGVVGVGNGTAGDKSGTLSAATFSAKLLKGPATAPSGACSVVGWAFSQDGHVTFCNGSTWVTKI